MSEELDSNVNNLSVAEEAFEVYHSNSMYSGDECATLPDRESREPAAGDGASELSDMSLENDIVSSTNIEDQSQLSYCNLDVGSEVNIAEDEPDEANAALDLGNEANADPSESHETDYLQEQNIAVTNDVDSDVNMAIEEAVDVETVSSSETYQPTTLSPPKPGRGRSRGRGRGRGRRRGRGRSGRGKKTITEIDPSPVDMGTVPSSSMNLNSESISDSTLEPANNEITSVQSEINGFASPTESVDTSSQEVPVGRKRGRKKKEPLPVSDSESLRSTEEGSPKVPRKRGRPRKSLPPVNGDTLPATTSGSEMKDTLPATTSGSVMKDTLPATTSGSEMKDTLPATTSSSEMKDLNKMVENLTQLEDKLRKMQDNLSSLEKLDDDMEDEDEEDICLSKLKTSMDSENNLSEPKDPILQGLQDMPSSPIADAELANGISESTGASVSEPMPEVKDIENNETTNNTLDVTTETMVVEDVVENKPIDANDSLLVEDVSKRPKRRNAKKTLKYKNDDDSDEDPFANVELSDDDEPRRGKKSGRYQSDDEYIPGRKGRTSSIDSSDSAAGDALEELNIKTKKRGRKRRDVDITNSELINLSPLKASNLDIAEDKKEPWRFSPSTVQDLCDDNDENPPPPPVSEETKPTQPSNAWATSKEFENFLAKKTQGTNLKIKKLSKSSSNSAPSAVTPLEIPVLDANEMKKKVDCSSQTNIVNTAATSTQTSGPGSLSMKTNVPLSNEQAENACKFLTSIVKTTSELGQLMTQKSDDFIKKKINTTNVVDTFKMDYCVKKSFLLLKLAKHNLMQMEEDLSSQYEKFLQENDLLSFREEEKKIEPKPKKADSDSDCEIIDETPPQKANVVVKKESKPKFNPKTVFLNKELSIKIAKKPTEELKPNKNINIKGRHTVWISDSVMVKKVKGSQSFLAQDSRNKKPPDNKITDKMVSDFFAEYNRQEALSTCAPFLSMEWCAWRSPSYVCNYFTVEPDKLTSDGISRTDEVFTDNENQPTVSDSVDGLSEKLKCEDRELRNPTTLLSMCVKNLQEHFYVAGPSINVDNTPSKLEFTNEYSADVTYQPKSLFSSCFEHLTKNLKSLKTRNGLLLSASEIMSKNMPSLKTLCYSKISKLDFINKIESVDNKNKIQMNTNKINKTTTTTTNEHNTNEMNSFDKIKSQDSVNSNESEFDISDSESDSCGGEEVKSLFTLCVEVIQHSQKALLSDRISDLCIENSLSFSPPVSLKEIAFQYVKTLLYECHSKSDTELPLSPISDSEKDTAHHTDLYKVKKLAGICFDIVSRFYEADDSRDTETAEMMPTELTINAVNTLSEEAFLNIDDPSANDQDNSDYYEDDGGTFYEDESMEPEYNENEDGNHTENESWISQVQLKELKYCAASDKTKPVLKSIPDNENSNIPTDTMNTIMDNENSNNATDNYPLIANIKSEPGIEETPPISENLAPMIKTEPDNFVDQMTIIPESIVTKRECFDSVDPLPVGREPIERQNSASFDEDNFEAFVRSNKMINAINNNENDNEETFSQSALRVRRQHEPDSDNENDTSMSLLVPHTFEALTVESAKGSLLQNSDSESENAAKKNNKRRVGRPKKKKPEPTKQTKEVPSKENKEVPSKENKEVHSKEVQSKESKEVQSKDKSIAITEVAILTRRMRERIRQEEKKGESSESDSENASQNIQEIGAKKETRRSRLATKNNKPLDNEIQCNNVDSTEHVNTIADKSKFDGGLNTKDAIKFTGFSAVDQNEISTYHKYVKYVYDQIIPKVNEETKPKTPEETPNKDNKENENSGGTNAVINPDEPIELLECTPTMPVFEEEAVKSKRQPTTVVSKSPGKKKEAKHNQQESAQLNFKAREELVGEGSEKTDLFTERDGWKCYPINCSDTKLYEEVIIPLEKLPESFVQTYFEYQDITVKSKDDVEIDRLTNLQSLNRLSNVNKSRTRKDKVTGDDKEKCSEGDAERADSPLDNDNYNELSPSEDEGANYDDDYATQGPDDMENNIAKNSLMNDDDDDDTPLSDRKVKKETDADVTYKKKRPGPKSKTVAIKQESPDSLMLTADKMMNKELTLLHAPVVLDNDNSKTPVKGPVTRNKPRSGTKSYGKGDRAKSDDSSSEEEKQWVNTKEKLLKRMGKKQETALEDDAKRAKLVSEFIERRNDGNKPAIVNHKPRGPSRRSRKKMLERQKQMRVLSYELLGEAGPHISKGNSAAYFKGRRNIRKVIDKKSLARSTVIANMEEFERKRRLGMKQKQLEELLGCEEGVNVIVTNDEVCLEYDFEVGQPAVTVHPFFTRVMKAHQYEGVKFMWDACFESLERVQSGHPGGGCILAHCMGLGKTLQVLALLHTVLTHPKVGMRRILVCCPLSTVLNWVDEIHKWIGPVTDEIKVFELSKLKKTYERAYQLEDWYNGGGIFIIGYELFRSLTTLDAELDDVRQTIIDKIRTALLDPGPDIIVCDEGHLLKNDCSVLAVAMSRVATRRRIVLTGTPMQNNLREYYCMVNFVKPNLLGTYSEFSNRFENPIMNGQHRDSQVEDIKLMKARTHILHKVLEGCLQRQEASVLYPYLPKKHEYTVFISLTKCQCDLYKHYLNVYANKQKQSILKDFHTLQKIWSHPQVLHNFNMKARDEKNKIKAEKLEDDLAREDLTASEDIKPSSTEVWWLQYLEGGGMLEMLESSNKFITVFRILEESVALDDKVLIFSTSLITMDALEYFLKKINKWSLGQEYYRLDGSVPPEVRQKWCREFNAENNYKTKLFLISTRAGSLGLNMTAANRVIILDTSWNPAHDIQSIFRVYRFGQKKDCFIYRLVALGTMEQKIYERAVTKQAVSCRVVDEQQIDRHYNMAELTELYRFDESGTGVAGGVAVGVQDVVLLRVARDAALHAVHEHDSLLRGSEPALPEHERAAAWQQFQQETQHNQMPNDKVAKKEKKGGKRSLSMEKPAPTPTMPEVKPDPDGDYTPPGEPKSKRGKKIINCRIPIQTTPQPSTSSQSDDFYVDKRQESDMVTQISQILVSHDFNSRSASRDLSKLIATVQQVVASGDLSQLPPGDEAAASIAQILLRKHVAPPMPALTDVRSETARPVQHPTEDPDSNAETITGDLNVKTRRKAAVSAQKKFDSIAADIVIDVNDNDWRSGEDFSVAPTRNPEPEKPKPKYKPGPKSKKNSVKAPEPAPEPVQEPVQPIQQEEESILLSDDEIVPEPRPTPVTIKQEPSGKKTDEKYPLHPSLLTNENFVKIVAHTYLAGNPMLDEDAATLAARYSTSKALKEIEATGKSIYSGPIYDIAMQVLGVEILKKLHNSGPASDANTNKQNEKVIADTEKMLSGVSTPDPKPGRLKAKVTSELMPKERKPKIANLGLVKLTPVTPVIAAPVVPVGLIKRAAPVGTPSLMVDEECILPDDDDVHVVSAPAPAPAPGPPPPPPPPALAPAVLSRGARAPPRLLNELVAQDHLHTNIRVPIAPAPQDQVAASVVKIVGNRGIIAIAPDVTPPAAAAPPPSSEAGTICLDSDDEDAPPVPVTLTAANSGLRLELRTPQETPLRPRPPPAKPKGDKLLLDVDYYIEHVDNVPPPSKASAPLKAPRPRPGPARLVQKPEPLLKPKSAVCKPGDILRIGKSGQVEVLNKVDSVPPLASRVAKPGNPSNETPAGETKSAEQRPTPNPKKFTSKVPEIAPKPVEQKAPRPTEKPLRVSSGSSSSSRSVSPEPDADPLSILKDVVQIPADRYQGTSASKPSSKPPTSSVASSTPTPSAPASSKPPTAAPPKTLFKLEGKLALTQKLKALKEAMEKPKKPVEKVKKSVAVSKGTSILLDSVDLTDSVAPLPQVNPDKNISKTGSKPNRKVETVASSSVKPGKKIEPVATSSAKPSKKIEAVATVVGTSKNIILTGSGRNKISVGPAPSSSSKGSLVRVTNMETVSPASFKRTDKKRPAIKQEPETPKRKKTEPMTLKDFDIDDIDDIIELE